MAHARLLLVAAMAACAGCGDAESPRGPLPYPVKGSVTFQGKPAAGFHVSFVPQFEQSGPAFAPSAETDATGHFELESYSPGDGAAPGDYAVTFTWPKSVPGPDPDDAPQRVDQLRGRYSDANRSPFKVTVEEGENQLEPFVLQ